MKNKLTLLSSAALILFLCILIGCTEKQINDIRLDEINPEIGTTQYGEIQKNKSFDENQIRINGVAYDHGVGTIANSEIAIHLHGNGTRFHAFVGMDDEIRDTLISVEFKVIGDKSKELWSSGPMKKNQDAKEIDIDISGFEYIMLTVKGVDGEKYGQMHADWADASLSYASSEIPVAVRPVAVEMKPTFKQGFHHFAVPNTPVLVRLGVFGKPPVKVRFSDLPEELEYDKKRNILTGQFSEVGVYRFKIHGENSEGQCNEEMSITVSNDLLAPTPPMGWMPWNVYGFDISEEKTIAICDAMIETGMLDLGYNIVAIDDQWTSSRIDGVLKRDSVKFPSGLKYLADYIHSKGMKLTIYSDAAEWTCGGADASLGYEINDANLFASWGIDYLKYDYCNAPPERDTAILRYKAMSDALKATGRDFIFSACEWGDREPWLWASEKSGAHLWRTTWDSRDIWDHKGYNNGRNGIINGFDRHVDLSAYNGPNRWNDPDMLVAGLNAGGQSFMSNVGCTFTEYQSNMSLWCLISGPLLTSFKVMEMNEETKKILLNEEAISINQDVLGDGARRLFKDGPIEIWAKDIVGGRAVGLLNKDDEETNEITVTWEMLELKGRYDVRDVWLHQDMGSSNSSYSASVKPHEVVLLKVIGPST